MQRSVAPAESDLLCENCGYILNGLDAAKVGDAVCPECGEPLADSVEPGRRKPAPIEERWTRETFWQTTFRAIAAKKRFYRSLITRTDTPAVSRFGRIHRMTAGGIFALAATFHAAWLAEQWGVIWTWPNLAWLALAAVVFVTISLPMLGWLTKLAVFLTATESRFWGMRLPSSVVTRAMNLHAANYLPVAIVALVVTAGFRLGLITRALPVEWGVPYLWTLCTLVVISAFWLFESYVVAMRRIRLANF